MLYSMKLLFFTCNSWKTWW